MGIRGAQIKNMPYLVPPVLRNFIDENGVIMSMF